MNILIVDDNPAILSELTEHIDWELFHSPVLQARSYDEALQVFQGTFVDILISDIEMPGRDGLSLISYVNEHSPHTECIILTRHDEFPYAQAAVRLYCIDYLLKPVQHEQLKNALVRAGRRVEARRQHEQMTQYGHRYLEGVAEKKAPKAVSPLDTAVEYISAHLAEELSVRELAAICFVSADHLSRLFKKKFGLTVSEYIQAKRIHLAAQLLRRRDITVSMAAGSVGFSNYSYFTEQFKRIYQITPREYQKQMLEQELLA